MSVDVGILLFGHHPNTFHRFIVLAGGLYLLILVPYLLLTVFTHTIPKGKHRKLERVLLVGWVATAVFGIVGLSAWNGYANGGMVVSIAVGAAPVLAFLMGATLVSVLNIVTADLPAWVFLWYLLPGIVLGALSFVLGVGLDAAVA